MNLTATSLPGRAGETATGDLTMTDLTTTGFCLLAQASRFGSLPGSGWSTSCGKCPYVACLPSKSAAPSAAVRHLTGPRIPSDYGAPSSLLTNNRPPRMQSTHVYRRATSGQVGV